MNITGKINNNDHITHKDVFIIWGNPYVQVKISHVGKKPRVNCEANAGQNLNLLNIQYHYEIMKIIHILI